MASIERSGAAWESGGMEKTRRMAMAPLGSRSSWIDARLKPGDDGDSQDGAATAGCRGIEHGQGQSISDWARAQRGWALGFAGIRYSFEHGLGLGLINGRREIGGGLGMSMSDGSGELILNDDYRRDGGCD
ncbi:hypothetical protein M0R45_006926 [Rubus argutus]|uniref:Uncharacterized protein n=1 Tax=Rubus argutus TaxID=59490 RepID=A0AAW1YRW4_RUBAR